MCIQCLPLGSELERRTHYCHLMYLFGADIPTEAIEEISTDLFRGRAQGR